MLIFSQTVEMLDVIQVLYTPAILLDFFFVLLDAVLITKKNRNLFQGGGMHFTALMAQ